MEAELVVDALDMALHNRKPKNVIHHSDQGLQYTSIAFSKRCESAGVRPSMGSVGDCYDNALCESFNAILECELLVKHRFATQRAAALEVFEFIEGFLQSTASAYVDREHLAYGVRAAHESGRLMSNPKPSAKAGQPHHELWQLSDDFELF